MPIGMIIAERQKQEGDERIIPTSPSAAPIKKRNRYCSSDEDAT